MSVSKTARAISRRGEAPYVSHCKLRQASSNLVSHLSSVNVHSKALTKLDSLEKEFRSIHIQLIDLLDDEEDLLTQQEALDQANDDIADLKVRLTEWTKSATPTAGNTADNEHERRILSRKLAHLDRTLHSLDYLHCLKALIST